MAIHSCLAARLRARGRQRLPLLPSMVIEEQNGWVTYDAIGANFRVHWQGLLLRPTFESRLDALRYLGALRNGLRKPDFAEQLPAPETNAKNIPEREE